MGVGIRIHQAARAKALPEGILASSDFSDPGLPKLPSGLKRQDNVRHGLAICRGRRPAQALRDVQHRQPASDLIARPVPPQRPGRATALAAKLSSE